MMKKSEQILTGVRSYNLLRKNGSVILKGHFGYEWETSQMEALCGRSHIGLNRNTDEIKEHMRKDALKHLSSKYETCHCGIYGVVDKGLGGYQLSERCKCTVTGWGLVSLNEYGWRAQHAKIEKIFLGKHTCDLCDDVISHLSFLSTREGLVQYFLCRTHVEENILSGARRRLNYKYVPAMEVMSELGSRYQVPVDWGSPWT